MNIKDLIKIGFSDKEARVYFACLESGHGDIRTITNKSKLPKSTAYDVLDTLSRKQLVSMYIKKGKRYFVAGNPKILVSRIGEQQRLLSSILPELNALYAETKNQPKVRFFEGKAGLKLVLDEMLDEATEILSISSVEDIMLKLSEYFPKFSQDRARRKIPIRILSRDSEIARERQRLGKAGTSSDEALTKPNPISRGTVRLEK